MLKNQRQNELVRYGTDTQSQTSDKDRYSREDISDRDRISRDKIAADDILRLDRDRTSRDKIASDRLKYEQLEYQETRRQAALEAQAREKLAVDKAAQGLSFTRNLNEYYNDRDKKDKLITASQEGLTLLEKAVGFINPLSQGLYNFFMPDEADLVRYTPAQRARMDAEGYRINPKPDIYGEEYGLLDPRDFPINATVK